MTSTYPRQDLSGPGAARGTRTSARSAGTAAFGIASVSSVGLALMGVIMTWLRLPGAVLLLPVGSMMAIAFGVTSLARREHPRFLGIAGLVVGAIALLAMVLLVALLISALASWQG